MGAGRLHPAVRAACGGILLLLAAVPATAAETVSDLAGLVTDPTGRPVANATVRLLGTTSVALSATNGSFLLLRVAPGNRTLLVTAQGYVAFSTTVRLPHDDAGGIEITLRPWHESADAWRDAFDGSERYGGRGIRGVPSLLRRTGPSTDPMMGDDPAASVTRSAGGAEEAGSSDPAAGLEPTSRDRTPAASALRLAVLSNGHFRREGNDEAYRQGSAEVGGRLAHGLLHYVLGVHGRAADATPEPGPGLAASPFRYFPTWIREADDGRIRAHLAFLPGSLGQHGAAGFGDGDVRDDGNGADRGDGGVRGADHHDGNGSNGRDRRARSLTVDLDYAATTGATFAEMWSRPGYVQEFLDTTQTGDVVQRHGRYSPTRLDESYVRFDPRDHLPTEEETDFAVRTVLAEVHSPRLESALSASFTRQTHTSRVAGRSPEQYEGQRETDLWFNYTDRELGEYFVIANDFPRYAEGTRSELRLGLDLRIGDAGTPLALGAEVGRVDLDVFEVLRPYQTNPEGDLGNPRTDHDGAHPTIRAHVARVWEVDSLRISAALAYEQFDLLAEWPASVEGLDPAREVLPRVEIDYAITPVLRVSLLGARTARGPNAGYPESAADALAGRYRADPALVPESTTSLRAGVLRTFGRTQAEVALLLEDTSEFLTTAELLFPGELAPRTGLTNGTAIETRVLELRIAQSFAEGFGGTVRYRLGESREQRPGAEASPAASDLRHLVEASADFGLPGRSWMTARLRLAGGLPFTPRTRDFDDVETYHSRRLPSSATLDLDAEHRVRLLGQDLSVFLETRNLLDTRNLADLEPLEWPLRPGAFENEYRMYYTETGRIGGAYLTGIGPDEDAGRWVPLGDPRVSGPPRRIRVGVSVVL